MASNLASAPDSSSGIPVGGDRFVGQKGDVEDVLKTQAIGLVNLSDYRKRRAEAIEQTTRMPSDASGASTPLDG